LAGAIWYTTRRRRCQAPALKRARHPERGGGTEAPQAFCRGQHMGRVGFDPRSFFPWDGRSPVSHPTCDVPCPPRRTGEYRKGMISASPLYPGVRRSVWDPETSRERIGDWGGPDGLGPLVCCRKAATWPNGEWRYSTRRHMLEPERPEAVLPDRALCLATFSHFLIVNKTSLFSLFSLSLSLSLAHTHTRTHIH
jgi:hypothetical protein